MRTLLLLVMTLGLGCGSDDETKTTQAPSAMSESGTYEVAIDPNTWSDAVGETSFQMTFSDADGRVHVTAVAVDPFMPMHGHGSTKTPTTMMEGHGIWFAKNVLYTMPGGWELHIKAQIHDTEELFMIPVEVH